MPVIKLVRSAIIVAALVVLSFNSSVGDAASARSDQRQAVQSGVELERERHWLQAIEHYEDAVKQWPESDDLKYGLRRAKIHFGIDRRYSDSSFQDSLTALPRESALNLFDEVLQLVRDRFVEPLSSTSFVAHGTESLYLSLANSKFQSKYLANVDSDRIAELRQILRNRFWNKPVAHRHAARQTVAEVCEIAANVAGLQSGPVVMEYIFGGCNALDDYSSCLTPTRLEDLYSNIDGEFVGLGVEIKGELGKGLLLVDVLPESPAAEGGILPGEYIVGIDGTNCRYMTTDEAANLLKGREGSRVRVEVDSPLEAATREATLVRRAVQVKSIPVAEIVDRQNAIGYIKMTGFQKTTPRELDEALKKLDKQGMRALIWDVRRNPGGLLTAAVEVLDRFIDNGVLVSTKGRTRDQNWTYRAHRAGTLRVPIVLLTDGESASASEIVAGAMRDHHRGTIVGRQTYGKWSVQSIFTVSNSTGLRLTTAKFYSPNGQTLGKVGVRPDVIVEKSEKHRTMYRGRGLSDASNDADLRKAMELLSDELTQR